MTRSKNPSPAWLVMTAMAFALGTSSCALTSKADLVTTRYFTPEGPRARLHAAETSGSGEVAAKEIRLGRITSGSHLRERIAYRDAAYETSYYEDQRWTERPEIYVRHALTRTLFEEHRFRRVIGGSAPTLDVEVVAFDEIRLPNSGRAARVELKVVLYEDRAVILEDTITLERVVAATGGGTPKIEDIVAAMGQALDGVAEQVATRVGTTIAARPTH